MAVIAYSSASAVACLIGGSAITKSLSSAWAIGNGGGLDTGPVAANQSYIVHLIERTSDQLRDALLSTSPANPILPSGWELIGRMGAVHTDSSANILPFDQKNDEFWFRTAQIVCNTAINDATYDRLRDLPVPFGVKVEAILYADFKHAFSTQGWGWLCDPDSAEGKGETVSFKHMRAQGQPLVGSETRCWTSASAQVFSGDTAANATLTLICKGWRDPGVIHA